MSKVRFLLLSITIGLAACSPTDSNAPISEKSVEHGEPKSEGGRFVQREFDQIDSGGKGFLSAADIESYRARLFVAMDTDSSNDLQLDEFTDLDYGFSQAADQKKRRAEYDMALKIVFSLWDRDNDGRVSEAEHRFALVNELERIDLNQNGKLEKTEFINGFSTQVAIRSVLEPD